ncbi:MAG: glutaredoxin family protein [Candidatus Hodarchaeales archaeon]
MKKTRSALMSLDSITIPDSSVHVEGDREQSKEIFVFAISTCMWCKRGKKWLEERGYSYDYLNIDKIPVDVKNEIKKKIRDVFGVRARFPILIVNKTKWNSGYNPKQWEELLQ